MRSNSTAIKCLSTLLVLLTLISGVIPLAYADHGYSYEGRYWRSDRLPIGYYINPTNKWVPETSFISAVQMGFDAWEADPASFVDFNYLDTTTRYATLGDGWSDVDWKDLGPDGPVAQVWTWPWWASSFWEADMEFNEYLRWTTTGQVDRDYDVQNVATHEAGHFLPLNDLGEPQPSGPDDLETMWWEIPQRVGGETKKRSIEWGDRAGLRYIFPYSPQVPSG